MNEESTMTVDKEYFRSIRDGKSRLEVERAALEGEIHKWRTEFEHLANVVVPKLESERAKMQQTTSATRQTLLSDVREQVAHLKLPVTYNSLDIGFNEAIEKVLGVFDGN